MSNSFEHFEKRFFCLLGRLRRHKGWMSEQSERNQSHRKEWSSTTNACGGINDELANEVSEVNPGKSGLSKFFTIFAEINKYNKYENKIEYTD